MLNLNGDIIGINNFIITGSRASQGSAGVGFAISSNLVKRVVDDIIQSGTVIRPWLGITMQLLTPQMKHHFSVTKGVLVSDVTEGGPAAEAGIQPGDVILKIGKKEGRTPSDVQRIVLRSDPGESVPITVQREGEVKTYYIEARRKAEGSEARINSASDILEKLGLGLQKHNGDLVVSRVLQGSPSASQGMRQGDIVLRVNRKPVDSIRDVVKALRTSKQGALFYIERQGRRFYVSLKIE